MFTWAKIAEYALGIFYRLTGWEKQQSDENTGRQLQNADNQKASIKGDEHAARTEQDVANLSDDALDAELRNGPPGTHRE